MTFWAYAQLMPDHPSPASSRGNFEAGSLGLPDVISRVRLGCFWVMPLDRLDNRTMLTIRLGATRRYPERAAMKRCKGMVQSIQRLKQVLIVGGLVDGQMKATV